MSSKWVLELTMLSAELEVRKYSKDEIEKYKETLEIFLNFLDKSPESIELYDFKSYIESLKDSKNYSEEHIKPITFFLVSILGMNEIEVNKMIF